MCDAQFLLDNWFSIILIVFFIALNAAFLLIVLFGLFGKLFYLSYIRFFTKYKVVSLDEN